MLTTRLSSRVSPFSRLQRPRCVALFAALLLLAGCTANFVYERIDWFIVWKVQEYVTLTSEQKEVLKADLQARLDYIRINDLPRAAALIDRTAREVESGYVSPEMIDARYAEMLAAYDEFMLGIVPLSQRFLRGLSREQVAELFANFEDLNAEMYDDYSGRTAETREKNRNKSAIKGMQDFTGRLREEQRAIIRDGLAQMEDASEQWIENQREWQRQFRELIETRPDAATYNDELTQLLVYPRYFHSAEYRARVDRNRAIFNDMFARLLNSLDDRQRGKAVRKLDSYVAFLNKLIEAD